MTKAFAMNAVSTLGFYGDLFCDRNVVQSFRQEQSERERSSMDQDRRTTILIDNPDETARRRKKASPF